MNAIDESRQVPLTTDDESTMKILQVDNEDPCKSMTEIYATDEGR